MTAHPPPPGLLIVHIGHIIYIGHGRSRSFPPSVSPTPSAGGRIIGPIEAARLLDVGHSTIKRWIDSGAIPAHRTLGGHRRIRERDLLSFAEEKGIPIDLGAIGAPPRVLLVDDERDFLKTFSERIRSLRPDVEVLTAESGFDAGVLIGRRPPEVVLLDIRMPGVSGTDVCRAVKGNPETAETTVVGVTGRRDRAAIQGLLRAGAAEVLLKPIEPSTISELLDRLLPAAGR